MSKQAAPASKTVAMLKKLQEDEKLKRTALGITDNGARVARSGRWRAWSANFHYRRKRTHDDDDDDGDGDAYRP